MSAVAAVQGEPNNSHAIGAKQHFRLWHIILVAMLVQVAGAQNFGSDFTVFRNQEDFADFDSTAAAQNAIPTQNTNLLTLLGQFFPESGNSVNTDGDGGNTVTGQRTTLINSATAFVPPAPVQVVRTAMNSGLRR